MKPENRFRDFGYPLTTTDLIIEYKNRTKEGIVLVTRKNPPYGIALPGGFAEYGLSLEENAAKEAREETGLAVVVKDCYHPFCVRSDPDRDPRGHMISVTYIVEGYGKLKAGDDAKEARLYSLDELRDLIRRDELAFDHDEILSEYLEIIDRSTPIPGGWI
jgi:ADP-ribose pyrophosphatase YjhB (NUDIX family)